MFSFNQMGTVENPYEAHEFEQSEFQKFITEYFKDETVTQVGKKIWSNAIISFDTETTSLPEDVLGEKFAFVYIWQIALGANVWYGRYLHQLRFVLDSISESSTAKVAIYVHNLKYDWYFMKDIIEWDDVFFIHQNKAIKANYKNIEFRCSYMLSGKSLDAVSKGLRSDVYGKKTGDLDYELIRTPDTELDKQELDYCFYDVLTMNQYLLEYLEDNKYRGIADCTLTKTGRVRKIFRDATIHSDKPEVKGEYRRLINRLTLDKREYQMLNYAFQGGFTHANNKLVQKVIENVDSWDIASSYPAIIVTKLFPMSKGVRVDSDIEFQDFVNLCQKKLVVFGARFYGVKSKINFEHFWPVSHIRDDSRTIEDNGRVVESQEFYTEMTNIDLETFMKCYTFDRCDVISLYYYEPKRLPREFVMKVLEFYSKKTEYKDLKEKALEYKLSKEDLNSVYGMMVTKIVRPEITYNKAFHSCEMKRSPEVFEKQVDEYNKDDERFLSYAWGVFVTAYARQKLWNLILQEGDDYIYSDTDSTKVKRSDRIRGIVEETNKLILEEQEKAAEELNIDISYFRPEDENDVEHPIGLWELDAEYDKFKTLGAKRYMYKEGDVYEATVSGWNKELAAKYLSSFEDPFERFRFGIYVAPDDWGSKTLLYSKPDCLTSAIVRDYMGKECEIFSPSWIHMEKRGGSLDISPIYERYLLNAEAMEEMMSML